MEPAFTVCTREGKCMLVVAGVYIILVVDGELTRNNDIFVCFWDLNWTVAFIIN